MNESSADQTKQPSQAPSKGVIRSWLPLLGAILFVVVTIAASVRLLEAEPETKSQRPVSGSSVRARDNFAKVANPTSLGNALNGSPWEALAGTWGIAGEAAYVSSPLEDNIAVLDAQVTASTGALITGAAQCGVVAGLTDANDYVAFVKAPNFGVWNLIRRFGGTSTKLAALPASKSDPEAVTLTVDPPMVTARTSGKSVSVVVEGLIDGHLGGLIASGPGASICAFDEVVLSTTSGD
jgi:hypothetical protein